jgi:hypothetical protein
MEELEKQIQKTQEVVDSGKIYIDRKLFDGDKVYTHRGARLSIEEGPYKLILENQLIILQALKNLTK